MTHLNEILNHLGEDRAAYFNAVTPPVFQTSNFAFPDFQSFQNAFISEIDSHLYTRGNNPTVEILRKKMAALEETEDALVFSSGVAAIAAAVMSQVSAGDHVVCVESPYSWTKTLLTKYLPRFGITHTFVDGKNTGAIEAAILPNTKVLFLESPNTMLFELQDLDACAQLAKKHGLVTIIDNSYCSPVFQKPANFGIDIIVHSGTKYLNGHSDVVCGVLCSSKKIVRHIFETELMTLGAIISPTEASMILRGLRTLELRLRRSDESAEKITKRLQKHPKIIEVKYPFAENFPQSALARRQMKGCGGLFSVLVKTDKIENMRQFADKLERFLMAVSWGGHESLVIPMAAFFNIPGRENPSLPWNLVRFYIGLEDPDWLWEDLEKALEVL